MAYTREQLAAQRETLKRHLDAVEKELASSSRGREGNAGGGDVTVNVEERDQNAALWEKLSPAEKMELYTNDRERWNAIRDAYEAEGMRKLLNRRSAP